MNGYEGIEFVWNVDSLEKENEELEKKITEEREKTGM